jgi:hypothetical protein
MIPANVYLASRGDVISEVFPFSHEVESIGYIDAPGYFRLAHGIDKLLLQAGRQSRQVSVIFNRVDKRSYGRSAEKIADEDIGINDDYGRLSGHALPPMPW